MPITTPNHKLHPDIVHLDKEFATSNLSLFTLPPIILKYFSIYFSNQHLALWRLEDLAQFFKINQERFRDFE